RTRGMRISGYSATADEDNDSMFASVTPGFFAATAIGLRAGREFDAHDVEGAEPVTIVSDAFARRFFAGRDPIGGTVSIGETTMRIVGVANDARYDDLRVPPTELLYMPVAQAGYFSYLNFAIRTEVDPVDIAPAVTRAIDEIAPGVR